MTVDFKSTHLRALVAAEERPEFQRLARRTRVEPLDRY